jgi:hypothetical protein
MTAHVSPHAANMARSTTVDEAERVARAAGLVGGWVQRNWPKTVDGAWAVLPEVRLHFVPRGCTSLVQLGDTHIHSSLKAVLRREHAKACRDGPPKVDCEVLAKWVDMGLASQNKETTRKAWYAGLVVTQG